MNNLADVFNGVRKWTPGCLIGDQGWKLLLSQVGHLPIDAAKYCAFEIKLYDLDPVTDFAVAVTSGGMTQYCIDKGARAKSETAQAWLGQYLSNERDDRFESLWLAYDITNAKVELPMIDMMPSVGMHPGKIAIPSADLAELLCKIATIDEVERISSLLSFAIRSLPQDTGIAFVGAAPGRQPKRVRFIVYGLNEQTISPYLKKLGWQGSVRTILDFLHLVKDEARRYMLVLDISTQGILRNAGIELYPNSVRAQNDRALLGSWLYGNTSHWPTIIDRLDKQSLCLHEKGQALLAWPCDEKIFSTDGLYQLRLSISHIKIAVNGERLQAKAYVGLNFLPG